MHENLRSVLHRLLILTLAPGFVFAQTNGPSPSTESQWIPATVDMLDASPTFTDVGALVLESPAGLHGFLRTTPEGHFAFEDGTRARFWGTSLVFDAALPPVEQADKVAAALAKRGYNLVRIHHIDSRPPPFGVIDYTNHQTSRVLAPAMLARLDHFVAALARRGIYYCISLHTHRRYREGDGAPFRMGPRFGRATLWMEPLLERQEEFVENLLGRPNVATGIPYSQDPGLALLEVTNETGIFSVLRGGELENGSQRAFPEPVLRPLRDAWHQWLREKYGSEHALIQAWGGKGKALASGESLQRGTIALPSMKVAKGGSNERFTDCIRFLGDVQLSAHQRIRAKIRSLGITIPVTGTQHYSILSGLVAQAGLDYLSTHAYWNHPTGNGPNARIRENVSMIAHPIHALGSGRDAALSPLPRFALSKVAEKPMTATEWSVPWPAPHPYELAPLAAAYGSFQDYDGLAQYAHALSLEELLGSGPLVNPFGLGRSPVRTALAPLVSLIFLRCDVAPGRAPVVLRYSDAEIAPLTKKLATSDARLYWGKEVPLDIALSRRVEREFTGKRRSPSSIPKLKRGQDLITDTGELRWRTADRARRERGRVLLATPRSAGVIGGLAGRSLQAGGLRAHVEPDGAVLATALDAVPLDRARNILVAAVSEEHNTGQRLEAGRVAERGTAPVLAQTLAGTIRLTRAADAPRLRAWALDLTGRAIAEIPLERSETAVSFRPNATPALLFALTAEAAPMRVIPPPVPNRTPAP